MHKRLVSALYLLVYLHWWNKAVFIGAFNIVAGLFDWLWCVFIVFNVIYLLFVNHLKDFFFFLWFTDCLMIGVSIHPWNHGRKHDLSWTLSATVVIIMCVLWQRWQSLSISHTHIYYKIDNNILSMSNSQRICCLWSFKKMDTPTGAKW